MLLKYACSIQTCFLALTNCHVFSKIRTNCSSLIWKRNTETSCCSQTKTLLMVRSIYDPNLEVFFKHCSSHVISYI
jgi:hypothetical protein